MLPSMSLEAMRLTMGSSRCDLLGRWNLLKIRALAIKLQHVSQCVSGKSRALGQKANSQRDRLVAPLDCATSVATPRMAILCNLPSSTFARVVCV